MAEKWRVLLPRSIDPVGPESIADIADCTGMDEYASVEDALDDIGRYDAIIVRTTELDADAFDRADRLRVVAKHGTGIDNVDVEAATERGIVVCNTPGVNARSVAEHAMALLLGVHRNLRAADAHVRNGGWDRSSYAGHELTGDTLGLLGYGSIARETADLALGMGLDVLAYAPSLSERGVRDGVVAVENPRSLFRRADAVSVHVPLTAETRHSISNEELAALGPDGVLVNTSRGPVVDEGALVEALERGDLGGAGLDVFEAEPPGEDHPLYGRDDVLLTPHVGGVTDAARERMSREAAANVRTVYEGDLPASTVNREGLDDATPGGLSGD